MENHLLHLGWFSARTFGTVLPETGTVKFINNFPLLITFLAENITKLGFPPWCHTKHNITVRNRHIIVSNQQYSENQNYNIVMSGRFRTLVMFVGKKLETVEIKLSSIEIVETEWRPIRFRFLK